MKLLTLRDHGGRVPALPSWLTDPLWGQFAALLPDRPVYDPAHPLGCHRRRIDDRIIFEKLLQSTGPSASPVVAGQGHFRVSGQSLDSHLTNA
jgi:hypothetical protein